MLEEILTFLLCRWWSLWESTFDGGRLREESFGLINGEQLFTVKNNYYLGSDGNL